MDGPSSNLRAARRELDGLSFYELIDDWRWFEVRKQWGLKFGLSIATTNEVPQQTVWYVFADADYPLGNIEVFPAADRGLTGTYPHQSANRLVTGREWTEGKICAQTGLRALGRRDYDHEPMEPELRLHWRIVRCRDWLLAADQNRLTISGEAFELPDFACTAVSGEIAFSEPSDSWAFWRSRVGECGAAELLDVPGASSRKFIARFLDTEGKTIRDVSRGTHLNGVERAKAFALWVLLDCVPITPPWAAPTTYRELRSMLQRVSIDLDDVIDDYDEMLRDGRQHHLLVGFPIPEKVGGESSRVHWQALLMPRLAHGKIKGFSNSVRGRRSYDQAIGTLSDNKPLQWLPSANWNPDQLSSRGAARDALRRHRILLVGCGALGSVLSELLLRAGCSDLVLADGELLLAGNLCRHTLTMDDLGHNKATKLAERLQKCSPHANVQPIADYFPPGDTHLVELADACTLVVDCSADDSCLHRLANHAWTTRPLLASVSLGLDAKRLFFGSGPCDPSTVAQFFSQLQPWLAVERTENDGRQLPREGIGCWHPVFPARVDDVWSLAAVAIRLIEEVVEEGNVVRFRVFSINQAGGKYAGIAEQFAT